MLLVRYTKRLVEQRLANAQSGMMNLWHSVVLALVASAILVEGIPGSSRFFIRRGVNVGLGAGSLLRKHVKTKSDQMCALYCLENSACKSFQWHHEQESCELHSATGSGAQLLTTLTGMNYYEVTVGPPSSSNIQLLVSIISPYYKQWARTQGDRETLRFDGKTNEGREIQHREKGEDKHFIGN